MIDIRRIRDNPHVLDQALIKRGADACAHKVLELDSLQRSLQTSIQTLQTRRNLLAKEIGLIKQKGGDASPLTAEASEIKESLPTQEAQLQQVSDELQTLLDSLPNILNDDVPPGRHEKDNQQVSSWETPAAFSFSPKRHFELGEQLGLMDFQLASKISGSRFVILKGALARLERAIAQFMLDIHTQEFGYQEVSPPVLVLGKALYGTGQLPKFEEDLFKTTKDHYLISTAEVSLTNMVRESILEEESLPLRFVASTLCFRSEAGAAGKDTRGMIRQHQFLKVELVSITSPDLSQAEHERKLNAAETILKYLNLPYRVMLLCAGDTGFGSSKTYDIEVWLPGEATYREISSCSNCQDFQARRLSARYRPKGDSKGNLPFVHTLNGSGLAVGRTLIAILENYQQHDGSIVIPDVLRPYMAGLERITP